MAREVRAGGAFVEVFLRNRAQAGLRNLQRGLQQFGTQTRAVGLAIAGLGTAILAPLGVAVRDYAKLGDQIGKMSARTGVGVEALSALKFAMEQSGGSAETLERGLKGMARFMQTLREGSSEAIKPLKQLGLSIEDLEGLSPDQLFAKLLDSLAQIEDPVERAGLAMRVFGRAGSELIPMIGNMERLVAIAREYGFIVTPEMSDNAQELTDTMNILRTMIRFVGVEIASSLVPSVNDFLLRMADVFKIIRAFISQNPQLIQIVAATGAALLGAGTALIVFGQAAIGAAALIGVLSTAIGALLSPLGLLAAAIAAAFVMIPELRQAFTRFAAEAATFFQPLVNTAVRAWEGIMAAFRLSDFGGAWQTALQAMTTMFLQAVLPMRQAWAEFTFGLASLFFDATAQIRQLWTDLVQFMADSIIALGVGVNKILKQLGQIPGLAGLAEAIAIEVDFSDARSRIGDAMDKQRREISSNLEESQRILAEGFAQQTNALKSELSKSRDELERGIAETLARGTDLPLDVSGISEQLENVASMAAQATEARGAFSARAAELLGGGIGRNRAEEETAENTAATVAELQSLPVKIAAAMPLLTFGT